MKAFRFGLLCFVLYSSTGDIIDAKAKTVVGQLKDETGREVQSEKAVEVLFNPDGHIARTVDRFGVGQLRAGAK
jgi:hypothetical protein